MGGAPPQASAQSEYRWPLDEYVGPLPAIDANHSAGKFQMSEPGGMYTEGGSVASGYLQGVVVACLHICLFRVLRLFPSFTEGSQSISAGRS